MTRRITRKDLEELVKTINKILGKDSYTGYFLEYVGGYYLCYINQRGGKCDTEEDRYSAREMYAYLRGILTGITSR